MKETENKAKMLNFEKRNQFTKRIFLRAQNGMKMSFHDIFGQKRTDMNQKTLP